jgi:hypothetical protein
VTETLPAPEAGPPAPPWRRWARRLYLAGLAVAAAAVLVAQRERIADLLDGTRPAPLSGALALGIVSLLQAAWFWSRCLGGLGAPRPVGDVLEATVASIPARYVPGSVWYAAGRITHLRTTGTPAVALALVALLETLLSFLVAVAMGVGLVVASGVDEGPSVAALVVTAVVLAGLASPWLLNPVLRWVARRRRIAHVPELRWALVLELCGHLVVFWASSAVAFVLYLEAFPAVDTDGILQTAGTFLLAWAAGFLAVFAPQGAGVFETAVAGTLDGASVAALAVVVAGYRAVIAVRDVVALAALAGWRAVSGRR